MEALTVLRNDTKVFDVTRMTVLMLMNSLTLDITYYLLKYFDYSECADIEVLENFLLPTSKLWNEAFQIVTDYIKQKDSYFLKTWITDYPNDISSFTESNRHLSNGQIATRLNELLSNKYPWREWYIVVLTETYGLGDYIEFTIKTCRRSIFHNIGRKLVIVSSIVPSKEKFELASKLLKKVEGNVNFWVPFVDKAIEIKELIGASCDDFVMFGTAAEDTNIRISGRHVATTTEATVLKLNKETYVSFIMF